MNPPPAPPDPPRERPVPAAWLAALERLVQVVDTLRSPGGCPWDAGQTLETLAPHLIEEAHEAADAVARGSGDDTCEELGDLLMGVVMMSRVASEEDRFDLADVAGRITAKLIRRHPHVYGATRVGGAGEVLRNWESIKKEEKLAAGKSDTSALSGVPRSLPALLRALRVGEKASNAGFDWPDLDGPREKVEEEWAEFQEEVARGRKEAAARELGDLLFALVNVARKMDIDPELALRGTVERFTARFRFLESRLGKPLASATLEEMDALWEAAKAREDAPPEAAAAPPPAD